VNGYEGDCIVHALKLSLDTRQRFLVTGGLVHNVYINRNLSDSSSPSCAVLLHIGRVLL
jgi:hypothetical protein